MGPVASHERFLDAHRQLLEDFVGVKPLVGEGYWQELLSFPVPLTKLSPLELETSALPYCEKLVQNNASSHNFQTLMGRFIERIQGIDTPDKAQKAADAVVFLRIFIKYLTESLNADDLVAFLDAPIRATKPADPTGESWVTRLSHAVLNLLVTTETSEASYVLQLEGMHLLLAMVSTQLYSPSTSAEAGGHPFTEVLMDSQEAAGRLLSRLLQHFIERRPLPAKAPVYIPSQPEQRGVLQMVRSAAASVLWLPLQALTFLVRSGNQRLADSPLCETGLLLLLALLHHAPAEGHQNPFQHALRSLQDTGSSGSGGLGEAEEGSAPSCSGRDGAGASFPALFQALGSSLAHERATLLLYDLLHACPRFRDFAVSQRDLGHLLLPLLQMLYAAVGKTASQMYMLLIVLLILSQDPRFSQEVHNISLSHVPWYSERLLRDTSLGSLMVVLLLRTAHYNLSKLKDVYLHTNTLAALANLAPHMSNLSSHAAQRLVSLFDMLARRYLRLSKWAVDGTGEEAYAQEMQVYFDFLRIVLEIINCIIVRGLHRNPELVYVLLHRQDVFAPFKGLQHFSELLENLQLVIQFFNSRIDAAREEGKFEWSVSNVLRVVKANLEDWPGGKKLRQFPELRFTYEEEANPEGFFVPYVWTLVVTHTTIPWRPQAIALFSPVSLADGDAPNLDGLAGDQEMARFSMDGSPATSIDAANNV